MFSWQVKQDPRTHKYVIRSFSSILRAPERHLLSCCLCFDLTSLNRVWLQFCRKILFFSSFAIRHPTDPRCSGGHHLTLDGFQDNVIALLSGVLKWVIKSRRLSYTGQVFCDLFLLLSTPSRKHESNTPSPRSPSPRPSYSGANLYMSLSLLKFLKSLQRPES